MVVVVVAVEQSILKAGDCLAFREKKKGKANYDKSVFWGARH